MRRKWLEALDILKNHMTNATPGPGGLPQVLILKAAKQYNRPAYSPKNQR
jgi:hypothetical protein